MIRRNLSLFLLTLCACVGFSFVAIKISKSSPLAAMDNAGRLLANAPLEAVNIGTSKAIQVALLLDTSSSMDGLIEQAKSQLWNILNELARTEKNDQETELEIALYEYGNSDSFDKGFQIKQLSKFTSDMDLISEKLFSLTTNGGQEYCGAVIQKSLDDLVWNNNEGLKMIYIAGNEPFTQGPVDYKGVCKEAKSRGIVVNTIFCGSKNAGIKGNWKNGAVAGGGDFISIDHNEATAYISTPYDDKIDKLNIKLNKTYIPYGNKGREKKKNQELQDVNAKIYSISNSADRISFKSSKKYKADDWDLVDAYKKDKSILKNANIKSDKYNSMTIEELESNILQITQQRESIQSEIKALDKKRREYKIEETKKNEGNKEKSLQQSIIQSVKKQAEKKGFKIKD